MELKILEENEEIINSTGRFKIIFLSIYNSIKPAGFILKKVIIILFYARNGKNEMNVTNVTMKIF
jgi:hypothetical protein